MAQQSEEKNRVSSIRQAGRRSAILPTLIIAAVLIIVFAIFTSVWTDRLWYRSFDFGSVFSTMLLTRIGLFLSFGLIMATIVGANAVIAYRMRPRVRPALLAAPCSSVTGRCSNPSSSG